MKEIIISKYLTLSGEIEIYEVDDSEIEPNIKYNSRDVQEKKLSTFQESSLTYEEKEDFIDFWYGSYWNGRGRERIIK